MSSTIETHGTQHGQNISVDDKHLYLDIRGVHGDFQRINIDALYLFFKEMFTTDWQNKATEAES